MRLACQAASWRSATQPSASCWTSSCCACWASSTGIPGCSTWSAAAAGRWTSRAQPNRPPSQPFPPYLTPPQSLLLLLPPIAPSGKGAARGAGRRAPAGFGAAARAGAEAAAGSRGFPWRRGFRSGGDDARVSFLSSPLPLPSGCVGLLACAADREHQEILIQHVHSVSRTDADDAA